MDEDEKNVAYIRGFKANELITKVVKDIYQIKKPIGLLFNKKNVIQPFEDGEPIEFICKKNSCPLFTFTSHSKKRPNNLVIGRLFDGRILDMVEFGVDSYKEVKEFGAKISVGSKPILIFAGEPFETDFDMVRIKNLLNDFFLGPQPTSLRVCGIEHVITFTAHESKIFMRCYMIEQKKLVGCDKPEVVCHEMGPRFDLIVRRTKIADNEQFNRACKQKPKAPKSAKNKNINRDEVGNTFGRIHIQRQDFNKMHTVKY